MSGCYNQMMKDQKLKIVLVEDEDDILRLFSDYLSSQGHHVLSCYTNAKDTIKNLGRDNPDIFLIDYRLPGDKNGIDLAMEIITEYPSMPILFVTAYEQLKEEVMKYPPLRDKKIKILIKPILLPEIEIAMINLVNNRNHNFYEIPT